MGQPWALMIEDDPDVVVMAKAIAQAHEIHLEVETNLAAGTPRIVEGPDLVILDMVLPDGHGMDVLRRWSKQKAMPASVVVFSSDERRAVEARELGARAWVTKPSDPDALENALEAIFRFGIVAVPAKSDVDGALAAMANKYPMGPERFGQYVDAVVDRASQDFEALGRAGAAEDAAQAGFLAHRLRPHMSLLGAAPLADLLAELEMAADAHRREFTAMVAAACEMYEGIKPAIDRARATREAPT